MNHPIRIYAVADLHGKKDRLEVVEKKVAQLKPDLLILPGDITGFFSRHQTLKRLGSLNVQTMAVRGNSEIWMSDQRFSSFGIVPLHLARIQIKGGNIIGVSGAFPLPFHTRIGLMEQALEKKLMKLVNNRTILVAHPPPYGTRDEVSGRMHAGSRLIKNIMDRKQPKMVLCGHIHERAGQSTSGHSKVINCSFNQSCAGIFIEWDPV